MKTKSKPFSERFRRKGLTLVEVVAATVLLGATLVAALSAFSAHREQLRRTIKKERAVLAVDGLMAEWFANSDWETIPDIGSFREFEDLVWRRTRFDPRRLGDAWPVSGFRVEVFERQTAGPALTSIEILWAEFPRDTSSPTPVAPAER